MDFKKRKVINSDPFTKDYINISKKRRLNDEYSDDEEENRNSFKECSFYILNYTFIMFMGYLAFKTLEEASKAYLKI